MSKRIPHDALVVVADGTRAVLFRRGGPPDTIKLRHQGEIYPENLDGEGPSGSRPPESSVQETDQATFAKQLANHINHMVLQGQCDAVVLAVDPQTLGQIRPILHKNVTTKIIAEVAKNIVNATTEDIEDTLNSEFA